MIFCFRSIPLTMCEGQIMMGLDQSQGKGAMAELKELTDEGHKRGNAAKQVEIRGLKGEKEESLRMTPRFPPWVTE